MRREIVMTINGEERKIVIEPCSKGELTPYSERLRKADMVPLNSNFNYYWAKDEQGTLLAFGGIYFKGSIAYFKAVYTFEEYRRNGLLKALFEYRKDICDSNPKIKSIEAVCTKMSIGFYEKYGSQIVKQFKGGFTQIRIPLQKD